MTASLPFAVFFFIFRVRFMVRKKEMLLKLPLSGMFSQIKEICENPALSFGG